MKISLLIVAIFTFANFQEIMAQRSHSTTQTEAPTQLAAVRFESRAVNYVYLLWLGNSNVRYYIIRIYRRSDDALYKKVSNVLLTFKNVTGLASNQQYYATTSAVYMGSNGREIESPESNRAEFETDEECTNGQVYLSCSSHCVKTCENPDPVCHRGCFPGCGCPNETPIWHEGRCIVQSSCPAFMRTGPSKPENLLVLMGNGNTRHLAWDEIDNAQSYTVKVRDAQTREVVQTVQSVTPFVTINNLQDGITYEFSVQMTPSKPQTVLSNNVLPPPRVVLAREITNTSFLIRWVSQKKAATHAFVLYDQNRTTLLASQTNISGNSISVENLAPGQTYYVAIASASASGQHGPFTSLRQVSTTGNAVNTDNFYAAVLVSSPIITTTPPETTTTPRVTRCRQLYASVRNFYLEYPGVNGPSYPNCDDNGLFVTKKCDSTTPPRDCWCIDPVNGKKVAGSQFGNGNSEFELDCDHYGNLVADGLEMEATNLTTTSVELEWNEIDGVQGYVLMVDNKIRKVRTISVEGASTTSYELNNLHPGHTIEVGLYAVDMQGKSSPMTNMEVSTSLLDRPKNVVVRALSTSSLRLSWSRSVNADGASIKILPQNSDEVLRSFKVSANTVIITDLEAASYTIEVREIRCDYVCDNPLASIVHSSEPTSVEASLGCRIPVLDLLFVFDASPQSGLNTQKEMAREIIERVPELNRQTGTRIAAVKYSHYTTTMFSYNRYSDVSSILSRIENITSSDTAPNYFLMLNYVKSRYFNIRRSEAYRKRTNAVTAVVVFSGSSTTSTMSLPQAATLLQAETKVITIGTSSQSNDTILSQIATNSDYKLSLSSSDNLGSIASNLTQKFCNF